MEKAQHAGQHLDPCDWLVEENLQKNAYTAILNLTTISTETRKAAM